MPNTIIIFISGSLKYYFQIYSNAAYVKLWVFILHLLICVSK